MQMYGFNYHLIYYWPSPPPYWQHKLINHLHFCTVFNINCIVHSHIEMTTDNISGTEARPCYSTKEEHEEKRRWMCSEKQIQHWEDRCVACFSHYRLPLLLASKLLIAADTHNPQSCSIETGGPLTAHNVGSIKPYPAQCWWDGNRKVSQLENSETKTEKEKLRPTTKLRQTALLSTSKAKTTGQWRLPFDSGFLTQQLKPTAAILSCFRYSIPAFVRTSTTYT